MSRSDNPPSPPPYPGRDNPSIVTADMPTIQAGPTPLCNADLDESERGHHPSVEEAWRIIENPTLEVRGARLWLPKIGVRMPRPASVMDQHRHWDIPVYSLKNGTFVQYLVTYHVTDGPVEIKEPLVGYLLVDDIIVKWREKRPDHGEGFYNEFWMCL